MGHDEGRVYQESLQGIVLYSSHKGINSMLVKLQAIGAYMCCASDLLFICGITNILHKNDTASQTLLTWKKIIW